MSQITEEQRYVISRMRKQGYTFEQIGLAIHKDKSSISRELKRNSNDKGIYDPEVANSKCLQRHRQKQKHISFTAPMQRLAKELIEEDYSPEQVKGFCEEMNVKMVSHERLYQYIWKDKHDGGSLYVHLRHKGRKYNKRGSSKKTRGQIKDKVSIHRRPEIANRKERFGDFEIDTIIGKGHTGAIVTMNDRASGWFKAKLIPVKSAMWTEEVCIEALADLKPYLHTITADNGREFTNHKNIAKALEIDFYFADTYSSWQRGANENLNGLLRQYIPKNTDFTVLSQEQIDAYCTKLNNRPRKRFGFKNPNFIKQKLINQHVAFMS